MEGDAPAKRVAVLGDAPSDWRSVIETRLVDHGWAITDADRPPDDASPDPLDAVVFLELDPTAVAGRAFDTTDESTWDALAEAPARRALLALQRAHRATRHAGLVFVLVQPVVALEGSAELVAATTGWEAQRVLVKSAARRWGGRGFRANIVGAGVEVFGPGAAPPDAVRTGPALGVDRRSIVEVADTIALLLRPEAAALTGATLVADGGALMPP